MDDAQGRLARLIRPAVVAGLLAVLVTTLPVTAAPMRAAPERCPLPQDNGYRPQPTAAGRKALPLPRLAARIIRDCLIVQDTAAGPVQRRLSVSPIVRFGKLGGAESH